MVAYWKDVVIYLVLITRRMTCYTNVWLISFSLCQFGLITACNDIDQEHVRGDYQCITFDTVQFYNSKIGLRLRATEDTTGVVVRIHRYTVRRIGYTPLGKGLYCISYTYP